LIQQIILTSLILAFPILTSGDVNYTPLPQTVEQKIEIVFGENAELMKKIAICESDMKQFRENGEPKISPTNDSGIFQINNYAHSETVKRLGLDVIHSEDDNIAYAKYLFERFGTQPWYMSEYCWG
jgi:hypothetical protein